jgi:hypothetical protein
VTFAVSMVTRTHRRLRQFANRCAHTDLALRPPRAKSAEFELRRNRKLSDLFSYDMADDRTLTAPEITEIGEALFGPSWQGEMAKAIGVPRQSVGHYLRTGGVRGAQTAAIIGLVARVAARELLSSDRQRVVVDARQADLITLLHRFDSR